MTDKKTRYFQQQVAATLSKAEPLLVRLIWVSLTLLLTLTLLAQLGYRNQSLLQQALPDSVVTQLCRIASCPPPAPARQSQLITVSTHQLNPSNDYPSAVNFDLTLINNAAQPQPYPIIDFWFEDKEGTIAARRYFLPQDYQPNTSKKMASNTPLTISLTLVSSDNNRGYQFKIR